MKTYKIFLVLCAIFLTIGSNTYGQVTWEEHPIKIDEKFKDQVKFGYLTVPENRQNVDSRKINMAFTLIKSTSKTPESDAVIYLPGGPGQGYSMSVERFLGSSDLQKILEKRDIILLDPRGCGYSYPTLCDNINNPDNYLKSVFLQDSERENYINQMMKDCKNLLVKNDVDIHSYSSVEVAKDVEELRKSLGYDQLNIRGHSYGSYFGFVLMQSFPESIRSAFISGIVSLNLPYDHMEVNLLKSLDKILKACESDEDCNEQYPRHRDDFLQVLNRLEKEPFQITLSNENGGASSYSITPLVFMNGLQTLMYGKKGIEVFPALVKALKDENDWVVENMSEMLLKAGVLDRDMTMIIWSNDADPSISIPVGFNESTLVEHININWLPKEVPERERMWNIIRNKDSLPQMEWKTVDVPTLMFSGEFDPATPKENAQHMLQYLSNVEHHIIPASGHDSHLFYYPEFFDKINPQIDVSELKDSKTFSFVTDISLNKGVSSLSTSVATSKFSKLLLPVISLILVVFTFLIFSFRYIINKLKKKAITDPRTSLILWGVLFITIVSCSLLVLAFVNTLNQNLFAVALGLFSEWDFLNIIYFIQFGAVLLCLWEWKRVWSSKVRILSIISIVASLGYSIFIIINGFI